MRTIEEIKIEDEAAIGGESRKKLTHPAFAQISAHRVSGHATLYGSDFHHQNHIRVSIARSELTRGLSTDWPHTGRELIEVSLSEAQWAHFVSSLNVGTGTQCTLSHVNREVVPGLPDPVSRTDQFGAEMHARQQRALASLALLSGAINEAGLSGKKAATLVNLVRRAAQDIDGNTKFVADMFGEHMEKVVQDAKAEVNAYALGVLSSVSAAPLAIAAPSPLELL